MDSPSLALVIALSFGFYVLIAESQGNLSSTPKAIASPSNPPPPPPPRPPPPSLPVSLPRPQKPGPRPQTALPPRKIYPPPYRQPDGHRGLRQKKGELNAGKKVGLMFIGIGVIIQVFVVALLLIRRRQLFNAENGF